MMKANKALWREIVSQAGGNISDAEASRIYKEPIAKFGYAQMATAMLKTGWVKLEHLH